MLDEPPYDDTMSYPHSILTSGSPVQPTAPQRPLTVGDLFSSTVATLRSGLALFVGLALAPIGLAMVAVVAFIGVIVALVLPARLANPSSTTFVGPLIAAVILFFVALMAITLLQYVFLGRTIVGAVDYGLGRTRPTWANLRERTPGLLVRALLLVLLVMGVGVVVYLIVGALLFAIVASTVNNDPSAVGVFGALGIILLLMPVAVVITLWLQTKLLFTLHAMADEGLGPWEAIKRSWQLTKGVFWRTLGHYIVVGLIVGVATSIPMMLTSGINPNRPNGGQVALIVVSTLLSVAVSLVAVPFQYIWTGLMFMSRRRELEAPQGVAPWYPPTPGGTAYPPQGQYPPQQPYPPQPPHDPWSAPQA